MAKEIVKRAKVIVDYRVLEIAVMWHDVHVTEYKSLPAKKHADLNQTIGYLDDLLSKKGFSDKFRSKVREAILYHEFGTVQVTNEAKVLYDADKLDALNPERWKKLLTSAQKGMLSLIKLRFYGKVANQRLKTMRAQYNFEFSRRLHDEKIAALFKNAETQQIAKAFGINMSNALLKT